jgi:hypothetical protein
MNRKPRGFCSTSRSSMSRQHVIGGKAHDSYAVDETRDERGRKIVTSYHRYRKLLTKAMNGRTARR